MHVYKNLWIMPFLSFITGYYTLYKLYTIPEITTPTVIGKQLPEAVKLLSEHNLNARLLAEKEDADLPNYTIVSQTPQQNSKVKAHQSVFLVVTKQPNKPIAPHIIGETIENIETILTKNHIRHKKYMIASNYPIGTCITQYPKPHATLEDNLLICYISSGNKKAILWPDFRGKKPEEVIIFLDERGLKAEIIQTITKTNNNRIVDQRPLPGSLISMDETCKPLIQLHIG